MTTRSRESGLASENILLLFIAVAVIGGCGWLFWGSDKENPAEARAYAERTLRRLLIAHDATYFTANLSPSGRAQFPPDIRERIIAGLTRIGVPNGPIQIVRTSPPPVATENHELALGFDVDASYPSVDAKFYLLVRCHANLWKIDFFSAAWMDKPSPAASASPDIGRAGVTQEKLGGQR